MEICVAVRGSGLNYGSRAVIDATFNVTKADVLAMACHCYDTSTTVRQHRRSYQIAIPMLLAGIGLLTVLREQLRPIGILLLLCSALSAAFIPGWFRRSLRRSAEKMIAEPSFQKVFGAHTLILTDEGLASKSPTGEGKFSWEAVVEVKLTPEHLFIMLPGAQGFPIPRSQIADFTIQEMKSFVESRVSERAK